MENYSWVIYTLFIGVPLLALVAISIFSFMDKMKNKDFAKGLSVNDAYKYYIGNPFNDGYYYLIVFDIWGEYAKYAIIHYAPYSDKPIIEDVDSDTLIKVANWLRSNNAEPNLCPNDVDIKKFESFHKAKLAQTKEQKEKMRVIEK